MENEKLIKFPRIEMTWDAESDNKSAADPAALLEIAKQTFCMLWPVLVEATLVIIEGIKIGWVKLLIKIGMGGINQLHNQICEETK